ncbi:OmpA family protein [Lewinella sp. W8]|uniref:OmpA family protein n=1 Tax=Lewinella sp. W8 TaxID=2528208 RepID=UPI0010689E76|nr:OmpA family protein [Lewinella sp. W8]MTB50935.1 OmpA family protein [Lewinella sp. W8]
MHRILLLMACCGLLLPLTAQEAPTITFQHAVYFATDVDELDTEARVAIDELAEQLRSYATYSLVLEAHADERGATDYNARLAERRAGSVQAYLQTQGLTSEGWEVRSFGEQQARRGSWAEADLRQDRRVDIRVSYTPWESTAAAMTTVREAQKQRMEIDPTVLQTISGEQGGFFLLEPNAFVDENGNAPAGPVTLELVETYAMEDFLIAGLTTTAGDRLLESGGMVKITAIDENGRALRLAEGQTIRAMTPTDNFNEQMRIFSGRNHDEATGAPTDWEETPNGVRSAFDDLFSFRLPPPVVSVDDLVRPLMKPWKVANPKPEQPVLQLPGRRAMPEAPDPDKVYYRPRGLAKIFGNKKKIAAKNAEKSAMRQDTYRKQVKAYQDWKVRTEKARAEYAVKMEVYEADLEVYEVAFRTEWERIAKKVEDSNAERIAEQKAARKAWADERKAAYTAHLERVMASNLNAGTASRYFFAITELGWTNIDIYTSEDDPIEVLARAGGSGRETNLMLIPDGRNSVLAYNAGDDDLWNRGGIPRGLGYRVVAIRVSEGQLQLAEQYVAIADEDIVDLEFQPVAVTELRETLAGIMD